MGLDMYVEAHRGDESVELVYFRKNWNLRNYMKFKDDDVCTYPGLRLEKEDLKKMIDYCAYNPDYWYDYGEDMYDDDEEQNHLATLVDSADGFRNVNKLCYLYAIWDKLQDEGWKIYYYDNY